MSTPLSTFPDSESYRLRRARRNYQRIKAFYLSKGRDEKQWQDVSMNPAKFNRVWRKMLGLALDGSPPPVEFR